MGMLEGFDVFVRGQLMLNEKLMKSRNDGWYKGVGINTYQSPCKSTSCCSQYRKKFQRKQQASTVTSPWTDIMGSLFHWWQSYSLQRLLVPSILTQQVLSIGRNHSVGSTHSNTYNRWLQSGGRFRSLECLMHTFYSSLASAAHIIQEPQLTWDVKSYKTYLKLVHTAIIGTSYKIFIYSHPLTQIINICNNKLLVFTFFD